MRDRILSIIAEAGPPEPVITAELMATLSKLRDEPSDGRIVTTKPYVGFCSPCVRPPGSWSGTPTSRPTDFCVQRHKPSAPTIAAATAARSSSECFWPER
jgi:hypothetical protein